MINFKKHERGYLIYTWPGEDFRGVLWTGHAALLMKIGGALELKTTLPLKKSGSKFPRTSIWIGGQTPPALQTMYTGNRGIKYVNGFRTRSYH